MSRQPFVPLGGWIVTVLAAVFTVAAIWWWAA